MVKREMGGFCSGALPRDKRKRRDHPSATRKVSLSSSAAKAAWMAVSGAIVSVPPRGAGH